MRPVRRAVYVAHVGHGVAEHDQVRERYRGEDAARIEHDIVRGIAEAGGVRRAAAFAVAGTDDVRAGSRTERQEANEELLPRDNISIVDGARVRTV